MGRAGGGVTVGTPSTRGRACLQDRWCQDFALALIEGGGKGLRYCGIAVLGHFWCGLAVIFISKYGIAVFSVQAVCGKSKFYAAVVGEKIIVSR